MKSRHPCALRSLALSLAIGAIVVPETARSTRKRWPTSRNAPCATAELQVGAGKGTVEPAGVRVQSYSGARRAEVLARVGPETIDLYGGREHSDS